MYENRPGDEGMGGEETDVRVVHLEEQIGERRGGVGYEVGEDGMMVSTCNAAVDGDHTYHTYPSTYHMRQL